MPNSAWGIDLGNRALKAIKLTREGDRLRVDDFDIIEHEQILSVSGDNKESMLQTALANFVQRHKPKGEPVGVAVSGQQSFARFIKLPPVEEKKIPEIVRFEAIQQIPFPLDDVEWSYQLFREKDSPDVEVGILAIKKDLVNRHVGSFTKLGLNVQCVQMHPLAVYNAMEADGRTAQTTMFMDSGAENTDLIITDGQTVWLRTLPIGGNNFTETLSKAFKLTFAKAEELKRNAATSKYAKQIFQAMRPVFADLVAEIQRSIGFYASVHRDARITKIVAQGSTFQLPGLQKYLQQNLQLPVEKLDSFKALPPLDAKVAANFSENLISAAGAYGLAIQTLGDAKITASLLPEHIRREKMWLDKTKWFVAAAATFFLGTGLAGARYYLDKHGYDANADLRTRNKSVLNSALGYANSWDSKVRPDDARKKIDAVKSLELYRDLWVNRADKPDAMTILQAILDAVPTADTATLQATTRSTRNQIVIRLIVPDYQPDLSRFLAADVQAWAKQSPPEKSPTPTGKLVDASGRSAASTPLTGGRPLPNPKRGFVVAIFGSTPNVAGPDYIDEAFLKVLRGMTEDVQARKKASFYIEKAELVGSNKADKFGIGYYRDRETPDLTKDRFFDKESTAQDTMFKVVVVAVLDPRGGAATASK